MEEPIVIVPYNSRWPVLFEREKGRLLALFAGVDVALEHVGSTAVAGLDSKPIIDIMLGVDRLPVVDQRLASIKQLGYRYVPELESEIPESDSSSNVAQERHGPTTFMLWSSRVTFGATIFCSATFFAPVPRRRRSMIS